MREIKFRVYDKDLAKYLEGCEIDSLMAELSAEGDSRAVIIKQICPARYIFEQYTGLKDRNGKEIYEGDTVKGDWLYGKDEHIVKYRDYGFYPFTITDFDGDPMIQNADIEVIGNIHENPELLYNKSIKGRR